MNARAEELKLAVMRCAEENRGHIQTSVPGLSVMRSDGASGILHEIYTPVLCLVLQGAKQVAIGDHVEEFQAGQGLIISVEIPVVSKVTRASLEKPYLALALDLDLPLLHELAVQVPPEPEQSLGPGPLFVVECEGTLIDCANRLIGLASRPDAEPILRPGIVREMHYLLLAGRLGATLRLMARPNSHVQRIARAVGLLRREFAHHLSVEALATAAGMSSSSFHQHFKRITSYSPLQFQKQLRLLEARRLMMSEATTARHAAFAVGYESVPQFTRDYAKRFGMPPRRETHVRRHSGATWKAPCS
jgi:AraC-like DNA-binding protein